MNNPSCKVFVHYLTCLDKMLDKIDVFSQQQPKIIHARLSDDMFPILQQAKTAIGFSLRACCPLADEAICSFEDQEYSVASVKKQLTKTREYLQSLDTETFRLQDRKKVETRAGFADLEFSKDDYFLMYTLPNFLFHYNMVYAIARKEGMPLGKTDYDGFHQYPEGFSFKGTSKN